MRRETFNEIQKWKRLMDINGSLIMLIITSPVILFIALYIKISSPGPIFYKSKRVGYKGKLFTFLKFRTMKHDNGSRPDYHKDHEQYTTDFIHDGDTVMRKLDGKDTRIFFGGGLLRITSLDELPQLINILKGEMSLVGPRPCIPYEAESYKPHHRKRLDVVPGLTGLWQVSGKNKLTFNQMIEEGKIVGKGTTPVQYRLTPDMTEKEDEKDE